ncbi:hypothetical protein BOTBODRAFT_52301 [Botryobasidium botryosum FD-172 SS1]|uniref:Major facilitator superfamily (MFS) profile domain-containing protein n=1 Tax=Botryobasidium botryosum (strain FD-172 SS1) TaxID=930990 RepID=A0A067MWQ6_BOTB1|nr:hypothetical protein BOTBODRAFT_52301 [Botryobasidium botryosum FD-172 SS1]
MPLLARQRDARSAAQSTCMKMSGSTSGTRCVGGVTFDEKGARDPMSFTYTKKWIITAIACVFTVISASVSSSIASGQPSMIRDLHCTTLQAGAALGLYALGFGVTPLITASFSEEFGRRPLYTYSAALFTIFFIPIALARNVQTVMAFRFLQGAAGSTGSTMVGGTIADIWSTHERGVPMALFAFTAIFGTGFGPIIGGFVENNSSLEWRWIQWMGCIISGVFTIVAFIFMSETRGSVLLTQMAHRKRKETGDQRYRARIEDERASLRELIYVSCTRPIILLCTEPVVASFSLWIGFGWGILYGLLESVGLVFRTLYNFNSAQAGLVFLSICIGGALGWISNLYQERLYHRNVARLGPEARLYGACAAGIIFPIGCFIYAWTSYPYIPWIAPAIGIAVIIWGVFLIYLAVFNYMADSYLIYASSALAGQSLIRNIVGTFFPLVTPIMYNNLGYRWAGTLLGCLASGLAIVPFVLFIWGPKIRARSRFAKNLESADAGA